MKLRFWGTRGSLPAAVNAGDVRTKVVEALKRARGASLLSDEAVEGFVDNELPFCLRGTYGSNTSCMELAGGGEYVTCDAGTGLRDFGNHIIASTSGPGSGQNRVFHIFISHLHWDHIQGFPFFTPAYMPGTRVNIYGFHPGLKEAFVRQQEPPCFPIPLSYMRADINFTVLDVGKEYTIGGFLVKGWRQNHPGDSFGYSFESEGRKVVYSTDSEHAADAEEEDYRFLEYFRNADLLIFDAQYALLDAISMKENWGHSNNIAGVELSVKGQVKRLCLFHNEPTSDDRRLDLFLEETKRYLQIYAPDYPLVIDIAYDGLEIEV